MSDPRLPPVAPGTRPGPVDPAGLNPPPLYACLHAVSAADAGALVELARDFSPRFECHRDDLVTVDIRGLDRLLGDPQAIGDELRRSAAVRGLRLQVAIAATRTAAMVLAHARPGLTVVERRGEAAALAPIPVGILEQLTPACPVVPALKRWGIRTLGELAALPAAELAGRLGPQGPGWQAIARAEDVRPLVPTLPEERFESSAELEWPIEGLEPLSFVLTRLLEPLSTRLERRDRGAAALHVRLDLVGVHDIQRAGGTAGAGSADHPHHAAASASAPLTALLVPGLVPSNIYIRTLELPAPLRDVRTLRTLILLDLESHPPPAAIERVTVVIDPTPGRVLQHTLFTRAHPTPDQLSTLLARLTALMGQDRIGRPAIVDSHRPGAFAMEPFAVEHERGAGKSGGAGLGGGADDAGGPVRVQGVVSALRRCRYPVPARVAVAGGRPVAVTTDRRGFAGGRVQTCTGPWRTSGQWWAGEPAGTGKPGGQHPALSQGHPQPASWNRDEWDVSLSDGAVYRIFRDRVTEGWFIDAVAD